MALWKSLRTFFCLEAQLSGNGQERKLLKGGHSNKGLSVLTASVIVVGEMISSGVLAFSRIVGDTGWIGLAIMVFYGVAAAYTAVLLGRCWSIVRERYEEYRDHPRHPYPTMGLVTFGKPCRVLISVLTDLAAFGTGVVFLLMSSQNISQFLASFGVHLSYCWWLAIVAALLCPICWLGTPKDFWLVGLVAAFTTSVACVIILVLMARDAQVVPPAFHAAPEPKTFLMAFGTLAIGLGGHPGFPIVQVDMKQPEQFGLAVSLAYVVVIVFYVLIALVGYLVYGSSQDSNLLLTITPGPLLSAVQVLVTLHLLTGFILILNFVFQEGEAFLNIPRDFGPLRVLFRTGLVLLALFTALTVPHFDAILALVGGSCMSLAAFIFPPLFYFKLCSIKGPWKKIEIPLHEKVACVEIMLVGALAGTAATYSAVDALTYSQFTKPCYVS